MDMQTIEDEIYKFNTSYFKDIANIIENELDFISDNHLYEPKENYTILWDYLKPLYKHFKSLDYLIIGQTASKLYADIEYLHLLNKELERKTYDIKNIFQKNLIYKSDILESMNQEIEKYKYTSNISADEQVILKRDISNFKYKNILFTDVTIIKIQEIL